MRIDPFKTSGPISRKFASVRCRPIWSLGRTFRSSPRGSRSAKTHTPVLPSYAYLVEILVARWLRSALCTSHSSATRSGYRGITCSCYRGITCSCHVFPQTAAQTELSVKRTIWDSLVHSRTRLYQRPAFDGHREFPSQKMDKCFEYPKRASCET